MPDLKKALVEKTTKTPLFYVWTYFHVMREVIYKPVLLLNSLTNPIIVFMLKFLHPRLFLKRETNVTTKEFTTVAPSGGYQMTSFSTVYDRTRKRRLNHQPISK